MKKIIISIIILVIAVLFALYEFGLFSGKKIEGGTSVANISISKGKRLKIQLDKVPVFYKTVGIIKSRTEAEISSRITARVTKVDAVNGQAVKKEQILAELDNNDLKAIVQQTKVDLESYKSRIDLAKETIRAADAEVKRTKSEYDRSKTLSQTKAVSEKTYEQAEEMYTQALVRKRQAELNLQLALSGKQMAETALTNAEVNLSYSYIKSPIDGIVTEDNVDVGDISLPGKIMFKVFDPDKLMAEMPIRESLISKIKLGKKVSIYVQAVDKNFTGEIKEITPEIDSKTRTYIAKVCLGKEESLVPGMFCDIKFVLGYDEKIVIPDNYITRIGQLEEVKLVDGEIVKKTYIETVSCDQVGKRIVTAGLKAGDIILAK